MSISAIATQLLTCGLLFTVACDEGSFAKVTPKTDSPNQDMPGAGDMGAVSARCRAAQGVAGTLLKNAAGQEFCIDFDNGKVKDSDLMSSGWILGASTIGCQGFAIGPGGLTIKTSVGIGYANCEARLPVLSLPTSPTNVVVAIVHTLTFAAATQYGGVELVSGTQKSGWAGAGTTAQTATLVFQSVKDSFQGELHAHNSDSASSGVLPAWQVQSIAVFAAP